MKRFVKDLGLVLFSVYLTLGGISLLTQRPEPVSAQQATVTPLQVAQRFVDAWANKYTEQMEALALGGNGFPAGLLENPIKPGHLSCVAEKCDFISQGQHIDVWLEHSGNAWLVRSVGFDPGVATKEPVYCVREGGFPNGDAKESDYPDCIWVDRIEQLPNPSVTWLPSHGGLVNPQAIRRYWCLDGSGDTPPINQIPAKCQKYFGISNPEKSAPAPLAQPKQTEPIVLELPALRIALYP